MEKLKKIHQIFIKRGDFTMDEKTLSYIISLCSDTRIDLAIYHALPPIVRLPIESIREQIRLANLFLQAA